ncbi:hypothetical protein CO046_04435 [Candidatus Peregrinibacteria bacterium CG_4_9_14_0_2_um_filter_53_11]|nr:MAG: hypothetical protein CO046_04435 [Candidatus Peregrinibacteria bacterium CG_4_9_14_0_2_um_filter_53_11]
MIESEIQPKQKSWYTTGMIALFVVLMGFSLYYEISQSSLSNKIARLETQKEQLRSTENEDRRTALRARALVVLDELNRIKSDQRLWSKVIDKIEKTIPVFSTDETYEPLVSFRTYNGNEEGRISANATTRPNAADPFADVATTIKAFSLDPSFSHVFVPSITKTLTPQGETVLSFNISFEYNEQKLVSRPTTPAQTTPPAQSSVPAETAPTPASSEAEESPGTAQPTAPKSPTPTAPAATPPVAPQS